MLVTSTGWQLEYIDQLGLNRGMEIMEYLAEKNNPQEKPMMITDESALFALQKEVGDGERPAPVGPMSDEFKDAIKWGEEMRAKHRLGSSRQVQEALMGHGNVN